MKIPLAEVAREMHVSEDEMVDLVGLGIFAGVCAVGYGLLVLLNAMGVL